MLTPAKIARKPASSADGFVAQDPVDPTDVDAIVNRMEVDAFYIFSDVYAEYVSNVAGDGRTPAHFVPFSRAVAKRTDVRRLRASVVLDDGGTRQVRGLTRTS